MKILHSPSFQGSCLGTEIQIGHCGWVRTDESWRQMPVPAPYSRLYLVTEGSGILISEREQLRLEPGYAYLAPCGCRCGFYGTDSVTKLFFHINIPMADGYDLFASCERFDRIPFSINRTEQLRDWFLNDDQLGHVLLKGVLWELISAFGERLCARGRGNCSPEVSSAVQYIRENLSAQLTVNEVCGGVFSSPGKLTKSFRQEIGVTLGQYIEDLVMQEAQLLLLATDRTVGSISQELGFCDQFYFTRRFSRRYGLTPREYRKNHMPIR